MQLGSFPVLLLSIGVKVDRIGLGLLRFGVADSAEGACARGGGVGETAGTSNTEAELPKGDRCSGMG